MPSRSLLSFLWIFSMILSVVTAFAPMAPVAVEVTMTSPQLLLTTASTTTTTTTTTMTTSSNLQQGIQSFLDSPMESSTLALSLKERPPPPTKEEIAAKKRNFNLLFWGGGFVAPFVATVYYFGPKFWTK